MESKIPTAPAQANVFEVNGYRVEAIFSETVNSDIHDRLRDILVSAYSNAKFSDHCKIGQGKNNVR